jgi:hypothetical protein
MDAPATDGPGEHPDFVNRRQLLQLVGSAGVARPVTLTAFPDAGMPYCHVDDHECCG